MGGKGASFRAFQISGPNNLKERFVLEQIAAPNLPRGWSGTNKYLYRLYLKKVSVDCKPSAGQVMANFG